MSSAKASLTLQSAITMTGVLQVMETKASAKKVWFLCRQVPGQQNTWLRAMEHLLQAIESSPWDASENTDILVAKKYVLKSNIMVFGWLISIEAKTSKGVIYAMQIISDFLGGVRAESQVLPQKPQVLGQRAVRQTMPGRPQPPGQHPPRMARQPREEDLIPTDRQIPPENFVPKIRVVRKSFDDKGRPITVEEMPLPHVYADLNVPNAKGKGAKYVGSGSGVGEGT